MTIMDSKQQPLPQSTVRLLLPGPSQDPPPTSSYFRRPYRFPSTLHVGGWWSRLRSRRWLPSMSSPGYAPLWSSSSSLPSSFELRSSGCQILRCLLYTVLIVIGVLNLAFGLLSWQHSSSHVVPAHSYGWSRTSLDNYHVSKDNLELVAPQPSPNATAIVASLGDESVDTLPLLILGHSISQHYRNDTDALNPARLLLYIPEATSAYTLCLARSVGWTPHAVTSRTLKSQHKADLTSAPFRDQHIPLALWTLGEVGVERAVYLGSSTLVRGRFDELFALPFAFAAVPDVALRPRSEDQFSADVLAVRPSMDVFRTVVTQNPWYQRAQSLQERLNAFFAAEVVRLPYAYNAHVWIKSRSQQMWDMLSDSGALKIVRYSGMKLDSSPWMLKKNGTATLQDARAYMHREVWRQRMLSPGRMYAEEVGWWEDAWVEMERERQEDFKRCESEDTPERPSGYYVHSSFQPYQPFQSDLRSFAPYKPRPTGMY